MFKFALTKADTEAFLALNLDHRLGVDPKRTMSVVTGDLIEIRDSAQRLRDSCAVLARRAEELLSANAVNPQTQAERPGERQRKK